MYGDYEGILRLVSSSVSTNVNLMPTSSLFSSRLNKSLSVSSDLMESFLDLVDPVRERSLV